MIKNKSLKNLSILIFFLAISVKSLQSRVSYQEYQKKKQELESIKDLGSWEAFKAEFNNTYSYRHRNNSAITIIYVKKGKVVLREFIGGIHNYSENGSNLNTHNKGFPAITFDEAYQKCAKRLTDDKTTNEINFKLRYGIPTIKTCNIEIHPYVCPDCPTIQKKQIEYSVALDKSLNKWKKLKKEHHDSYQYTIDNSSSWPPSTGQTTITVKEGKIISRQSRISYHSSGEEISYSENESNLNTHRTGSKAITLDHLYQECKHLLNGKYTNTFHDIYFELDDSGILKTCKVNDEMISDGGLYGVSIGQITW